MLKFTYEKSPPHTMRNVEHMCWQLRIEGDLTLSIDGEPRLFCPSELLLSFALCLKRWLRMLEVDEFVDFYYVSMECQQEPIVSFSPIGRTGKWNLESVWENQLEPVSRAALLDGVYDYLQTLHRDLSQNCAVDLDAEYNENVDEYLRDSYRMRATPQLWEAAERSQWPTAVTESTDISPRVADC